MRKFLLCALVLLTVMVGMVTASSSWCYQEFANVSTACGGLATGNYKVANFWSGSNNVTDGNWNTLELANPNAEVMSNYTRPVGSLAASLWQVKDNSGSGQRNLTLPANCMIGNNLVTLVWFDTSETICGGTAFDYWCHNNTKTNYSELCPDCWEFIQCSSDSSNGFYEEAMNWNISNAPLSPFIATWNTSQAGTSNGTGITLPITGTYTTQWGDGGITNNVVTHQYASPGVYTITINGTITSFAFNNAGDKLKILNVTKWGDLRLGNAGGYFYGCTNIDLSQVSDTLNLTGTTNFQNAFLNTPISTIGQVGTWNTSQITTMISTFGTTANFNDPNINSWDTHNVTSMSSMFQSATKFNSSLASWNTGKVSNFANMFLGAAIFNQNITTWNTSSATSMSGMFNTAGAFNQPIGSWNTSKVTDMSSMFSSALSFNQPLNSWDVSKVTTFSQTFYLDPVFNQNLSSWNTKSVQSMYYTFGSATSFNGNVSSWNTSQVTTMNAMFYQAPFNYDVGSWDVHNVTDMTQMFNAATNFNQNLSSWNTAKVTLMNSMFYQDTAFNGNISNWDVGKVTGMNSMFRLTPNFNQPINSWNTTSVTDIVGMFYSSGFNQPINNWNTHLVTDLTNTFRSTTAFNQNLSAWNTSAVQTMVTTFALASAFNNDLSGWDTSKVTSMVAMFQSASVFNQNLSNWNTGNVQSMSTMFSSATAFNGNISKWNTSKVNNMGSMFSSATNFNQPIGSWDTRLVTTMQALFSNDAAFNQDISSWNVSQVTQMNNVFLGDSVFNQPIGNWDTHNTTTMQNMFQNDAAFNQNLGKWNVSAVTNAATMFTGVNLSTANYDALLDGWASRTEKSAVPFSGGGSKYANCTYSGLTNRLVLNTTYTWTITDGGLDSSFLCPTDTNNSFISSWDTTQTGTSNSTGITLPITGTYTVNWGDGTQNLTVVSHQYNSSGQYTVTINGTITGWSFNNGGDKLKIQSIKRWGDLRLGNAGGYFYGCSNLDLSGVNDVLNLSGTTTLSFLFNVCSKVTTIPFVNSWNVSGINGATGMQGVFASSNFNDNISSWDTSNAQFMNNMFSSDVAFNQNINSWNTGKVTGMNQMFLGASAFNQPLNSWNTSSVTDMSNMFNTAVVFNQNLTGWDTSHVTGNGLTGMFQGATSFNGNISTWNTSQVTSFASLFQSDSSFNQSINNWDTHNVTTLGNTFISDTNFNQPLNNWNTSGVTSLQGTFQTTGFNQNISGWDVSHVTTMQNAFLNDNVFNQPLNSWNTQNVQNMQATFYQASSFNQNINSWDTHNVTNMFTMFYQATAFNQSVGNWNVSKVANMGSMFFSVTLGTANYDAILDGWASRSEHASVSFSAGNSKYGNCTNSGLYSRNILTTTYTWSITDAGLDSSYVCPTTPAANITLTNFTSDGGCSASGTCPWTHTNATNFILTTTNANFCNATTVSTINCTTSDSTTYNCLFNSIPIGPTVYHFTCNGTGGWSADNQFNLSRTDIAVNDSVSPASPQNSGTAIVFSVNASSTYNISAMTFNFNGTVYTANITKAGTSATGNVTLTPSAGTYFYNWTVNDTQNVNISSTTKNYTIVVYSVNVTLGTNISKVQWIVPFYTGTTAYNVTPTNQTDSIGLFNVQNNGTVSINATLQMNDTYNGITGYSMCYQESANISNQSGTDGSCGQVYNGSYYSAATSNSWKDGVWTTGTSSYSGNFYINYTIPANATSSSLWRIKFNTTSADPGSNWTIASSCWGGPGSTLQFLVNRISSPASANGSCWGKNAWQLLGTYASGVGNAFEEDGMWWNVSSSVGSVVSTFCSNSSSFSTVYMLNTSPTVVFNSLAVGSPSQKLWCMRNYTAIPTVKKNVVFIFNATSS